MMRCPPFRYAAPRTVVDAVTILHAEGPRATVLAGGTDVVPNLKRRQSAPELLLSLRRVEGIRGVHEDAGGLTIGAATTLETLAADPRVAGGPLGAILRAAAQVATPQIRAAATLGGNLCLDTRCNYYDQGLEWRKAIDFCMKAPAGTAQLTKRDPDPGVCWVAVGSPRCWAVSSTDLAPALIALGAEVTLVAHGGTRRIPLDALYADDGMAFLTKRADELLTAVHVPRVAGAKSTYWKLRRRGAFDFPVLGVGAHVALDGGGTVTGARLVLGAVASRPVVIDASALVGQKLTDETIDALADAAAPKAKPLDNTDYALGWRKRVAKAFVRGALRELRGDDPATLGLIARRQAALVPLQG